MKKIRLRKLRCIGENLVDCESGRRENALEKASEINETY